MRASLSCMQILVSYKRIKNNTKQQEIIIRCIGSAAKMPSWIARKRLFPAARLRTAGHGHRCSIWVAPPALPPLASHLGPASPRPRPRVYWLRRGFVPALWRLSRTTAAGFAVLRFALKQLPVSALRLLQVGWARACLGSVVPCNRLSHAERQASARGRHYHARRPRPPRDSPATLWWLASRARALSLSCICSACDNQPNRKWKEIRPCL